MDINLLADCRSGDPGSWNRLLSELYPRGMAVARGILRDQELAGDVVQNALLKVYRHLLDLRDLNTFAGWFQRIVTNEAYLALRAYRKEVSGEQEGAVSFADPAEQATLRAELQGAMRRLPLDFQEAVVLCDLLQLSQEDAAKRCGVPLGTLKSRLFRGREMLRKFLGEFRATERKREQLERQIEDVLYDYLEGRLNALEQARIEERIQGDPGLQKQVKEQKEFLRLLHSITGKISLSAAEVASKMQEVYSALEDYSYTSEETVVVGNRPQTFLHKAWFKKPNLRRLETEHSGMGHVTIIVQDDYILTYQEKQGQAIRARLTEDFLNQFSEDFGATLKEVATNNSTILLGTEIVEGRNCYHLKLSKEAPGGQGSLLTHLWLDKLTWMPMLTEQYNSEGNLISRKVIRNLMLNTGIPDKTFELDPSIKVSEEKFPEVKPPRRVSLEEARKEISFVPLILGDASLVLNNCSLMDVQGSPILLTDYHLPGQPLPEVTVSQGLVYHTNLPAGLEVESVQIGQETGQYLAIDALNVKGFISFRLGELFINLGGNADKAGLIRWAESLAVQE